MRERTGMAWRGSRWACRGLGPCARALTEPSGGRGGAGGLSKQDGHGGRALSYGRRSIPPRLRGGCRRRRRVGDLGEHRPIRRARPRGGHPRVGGPRRARTHPSCPPSRRASSGHGWCWKKRGAGRALPRRRVHVDGRVKPGHDGEGRAAIDAMPAPPSCPPSICQPTDPSVMPALEAGIHANTDGAGRGAERAVLFPRSSRSRGWPGQARP